jgi:hypothetical protein
MKLKLTALALAALFSFTGCSTTSDSVTDDRIYISDYEDQILEPAAKVSGLFDSSVKGSEATILYTENATRYGDGYKIKLYERSIDNGILTVKFKMMSEESKPIAIPDSSIILRETSYYPSIEKKDIVLKPGEELDIIRSFKLPENRLADNKVRISIGETDYEIYDESLHEKITDSKPVVKKGISSRERSANDISTYHKDEIIGDGKLKMSLLDVTALAELDDNVLDYPAYMAKATINISNTSDKKIVIKSDDIFTFVSDIRTGGESFGETNGFEGIRFDDISLKPNEIKSVEIPVLIVTEAYCFLIIDSEGSRFIFSGIENLEE